MACVNDTDQANTAVPPNALNLRKDPVEPAPQATELESPSPKPKRKRTWRRRIAILIVLLILAVPLYFGVKIFLATKSIITKNSSHSAAALVGGELKGEDQGRINILLLGIGGAGHDGPELTDTIMLASIDPKAHTVSLLSIPRDLYVKDSYCPYGCKINAVNAFGEEHGKGVGAQDLKKVVSTILDIPVSYYAKLDFSGFKQAVDALGGVDVNVPTALYDPFYPANSGNGYQVVNISAGEHHMNGTLALEYARSRETTSDFDRAARQQRIIAAIRTKALTVGTLTNPVKVNGLIDAIGSHVNTDLQLWEIQKLATIVKQLDSSKQQTKVLDPTSTNGLLISANDPTAGSIIYPAAGLSSYTAIQEWVHTYLTDSYLLTEDAKVSLYNGTTISGLAGQAAQFLKSYSYNITTVGNAPAGTYPSTTITDYTGGKKPYTVKFLEDRFHVKATQAPAAQSTDGADIKVVLGNNFKLSYINTQ
jgi:LCP family protein required for cell wall assembly